MMEIVAKIIAIVNDPKASEGGFTTNRWTEGKALLEGVNGFVDHDSAFDAVGILLREFQRAEVEAGLLRLEIEQLRMRDAKRPKAEAGAI